MKDWLYSVLRMYVMYSVHVRITSPHVSNPHTKIEKLQNPLIIDSSHSLDVSNLISIMRLHN